jgi:predicted AlkP superfamily pyrophosphatase or phosphodiesterase
LSTCGPVLDARRLAVLVLLMSMGACDPNSADAPPEASRVPKVLLIGLDGVRPDVLAEVATPNLDALIATGAFTDQARTGYPSVSGPGWSSMLNGAWPDKHGVTDNNFDNDHFEEYPDFLTRIEQARPELRTYAVVDWVPLVRSDDQRHTISDLIDTKVVLDGYELGWPEADSLSVTMAVVEISTGNPDALFVYLGNPDETSHHFESIGDEYRAAIEEADRAIGRLVAAVRARASYQAEDWLILSSTDHGRTLDGDHGGDTAEERTIFFLAHGPSITPGSLTDSTFIVDIAVTALTHLGIDVDPTWGLDGRAVGIRR